jgi:hypothetical protein
VQYAEDPASAFKAYIHMPGQSISVDFPLQKKINFQALL